MTTIKIQSLIGTGDLALPESDADVTAFDAYLAGILATIPTFTYLAAGVIRSGSLATIIPNALIHGAEYGGNQVLTTANTETMTAALRAALEGDGSVTSVGQIDVELYEWTPIGEWVRTFGFITPTRGSGAILNGFAVSPFALITNLTPPPGTWTDLDLSLLIGARKSRVWMVFEAVAQPASLAVRAKGDTGDYSQPLTLEPNLQNTGVLATVSQASALTTMTDASGVIQIKGSGASSKLSLVHYTAAP